MTTTTSVTPNGSKLYRVLIVDDHPVVREGLARLIKQESDIEVYQGCDNAEDALKQVKALQPDLVIVDMALRSSHGMQLLSQIKGLGNGVKTLVWSTFDERMFAERAIRAGAMGYVNKQEPLEIILRAVRQVLRGEVYLSLKMTKIMLQRLGSGKLVDEDPLASLSNREIEVFRMVGQGITTRQIARQLGVKPKTVEANREKIKTKLNLKNAAELTRSAVQWVLENG
jgi:DNA-binding NarL/FixJ family response regulator